MADTTVSNNTSPFVSSTDTNSATVRGTKIVKAGSDMDKNAFLKILVAELSNQDPDNAKDSTAYVTQMAQFTSLEQTANLNTNLSYSAANSYLGKFVGTNKLNDNGEYYSGYVREVYKDGSNVKVGIEVKSGEVKEFSFDDISNVVDVPNQDINNISGNMSFLTATSLIGKVVITSETDGSKSYGIVKAVYKNSSGINVKVDVQGKQLDNAMKNKLGTTSGNDVSVKGRFTGTDDKELQVKYNKDNGKYLYRVVDTDTDIFSTDTEWTEMTDKTAAVDGITITKPTTDPSNGAYWTQALTPAGDKQTNEYLIGNVTGVEDTN